MAADAAHAREQGLNWRGAAVLSWSGMRGVVTLAAAQSIPTSVPYRSQLVLIAFVVAVVTLLLHGLTLPLVIRKLRPAGPTKDERSEELRALYNDLVESGRTAFDAAIANAREHAIEHPEFAPPSDAIINRVRASIPSSIASLTFSLPQKPGAGSAGESGSTGESGAAGESGTPRETDAESYLRLSRMVLEAQRATILEERAIGQFSSSVLRAAEHALDTHELRFNPQGDR